MRLSPLRLPTQSFLWLPGLTRLFWSVSRFLLPKSQLLQTLVPSRTIVTILTLRFWYVISLSFYIGPRIIALFTRTGVLSIAANSIL